MIQGLSIRESAKQLQNISTTTLFYLRHKILSVIEQMNLDTFNEIVELDETYFLYSEKGSKKIKGRKPVNVEVLLISEVSVRNKYVY